MTPVHTTTPVATIALNSNNSVLNTTSIYTTTTIPSTTPTPEAIKVGVQYKTTVKFKLSADINLITDVETSAIRINLLEKLNVNILDISALSFEQVRERMRHLLEVEASFTVTSPSQQASQNDENTLSLGVFNSILAAASNNRLVASDFGVYTTQVGAPTNKPKASDPSLVIIIVCACVAMAILIAIAIAFASFYTHKHRQPPVTMNAGNWTQYHAVYGNVAFPIYHLP